MLSVDEEQKAINNAHTNISIGREGEGIVKSKLSFVLLINNKNSLMSVTPNQPNAVLENFALASDEEKMKTPWCALRFIT